ncbi:MAG TPA: COX15/CtaA family protein [Acidimicrobiales bacterium]|nr:COX15/CtaA family protein [Acidimicrobiales bacterium]
MAARPISPRGYRRVALLALAGLPLIIVVGGAVRLTGSGLGCPEWPNCESNSLVAPAEYHAVIEFANRLLSGLVGVPIILALRGALRRQPRRRDLLWLSSALVAAVIVQVLIGRLTVLSGLSPLVVMAHFLLAMAMLADGVMLHWAAGRPDGRKPRPLVGQDLRRLGSLIVGTTALVVVLGSLVTAAGPHGGDDNAVRLDLPLRSVAQLHGLTVVLLLLMVIVMTVLLHRSGAPSAVCRRSMTLIGVLLAQAAVGYAQYFTGVPVLLVGVHIAGAVAVWMAVLRFRLGLVDQGILEAPPPTEDRALARRSRRRARMGRDDHRACTGPG